jgi:probable HAF family extracellular repeat protein
VGGYLDDANTRRSFLLVNNDFRNIEYERALITLVGGINDSGQISGTFEVDDSSEVQHGYLLNGGLFTEIDFPGAGTTNAHGINNLGHIVGAYAETPDSDSHGYLWRGGIFTKID